MTQRQITLVNNSASPTSLALLQGENVVWLAKYAYPGTQVRFSWDDTDYCFVWSGTAQVSPGVVLDVSQIALASLTENNQISLSYDAANRAFYFHNQQSGAQLGSLLIRADSSIPSNAVAVGIGMANKPIAALPGQPNMSYTFTPRAKYQLAFGTLSQSEVVDPGSLSLHEVSFPPNVYALTATLGADNQWTVESDILATLDTDA